jgi:hypothetical protein
MNGGTVGATPRESEPQTISQETIFETLSNRRRRYVIHYLKQFEGAVPVRELSEQIAAWENGIDRSAVTPRERKRVYTALHQTHLPKMNDVGVVVYDRDRKVVTLTDEVEAFDIYLELVPDDHLNWGEVYLALAGVSAALVVVAALGIFPFTLLPGIGYAALVTVAVLVVSALHVHTRRRTRLGGSEQPPDVSGQVE